MDYEAGKTGTTPADLLTYLEGQANDLSSRNVYKATSLDGAILPAAEFEDLDIPERASLLAPFLKESSIGMVTADRGTGKTMFALGLCAAISRGDRFGPWEGGMPRNCLLSTAK